MIEGCQKIIGLFAGANGRGRGWQFLIMGRLPRAAPTWELGILDAAGS